MLRFLKWFCDPELHPFIEGDLYELYEERLEALGKKKADRRFTIDVLLLFRPSMIRSFKYLDHLLYNFTMLQSYIKISVRSLNKHRFFAAVNIAGMTLGLTCFLLIALYIKYEYSFDKHHDQVEQLYRVGQQQIGNDYMGSNRYAISPLPLVPTMKESFPEVEAATTMQIHDALFVKEQQGFYEKGLFADAEYFDVFINDELKESGNTILEDPSGIILTRSLAKKYFGEAPAIGQDILFEGEQVLTVQAVIKDPPKNQHFQYEYITSVKNLPWYQDDVGFWNHNNYRSYVRLAAGTDPATLETKMKQFDEYTESAYRTFSFKPDYFLQPVQDIHLHSDINFEISANGDIRYLYLSASIALIILLLAAINYMNLATTRTAGQAKEVGMRKVLGAKRVQLVGQFLTESLLITAFSFGIAFFLAYLLLPSLNRLMDLDIPFEFTNNPLLLAGLLLIALFTGALSGFYPAITSSAVKPINALKGKWFKIRKEGMLVRNSLLVGQFTAAIVLAICSIVIYQQLRFIQDKKIGFNREEVVYLSYSQFNLHPKAPAIRQALLNQPGIKNVSFANGLPLNLGCNTIVSDWDGRTEEEELYIFCNYIDYSFLDLFEIELIEGRNFSPEHPSDSAKAYLLNEAALKELGWESGVGKKFRDGTVIGVVKDFHFQPFDLAIEPLFMGYRNARRGRDFAHIAIKTEIGQAEKAIPAIKKTLSPLLPEQPFDPRYMDESYRQLYSAERRFGEVFGIFTFIALFIACMGLFGLVSHQLIKRTKEIGIRKVLGATVTNIVTLVSRDFLRLVMLSSLIAIPLAWWGMHEWLKDFAYRTELKGWVFFLVSLIATGLAFVTISMKAIQAALANPMDNLRSE